MKQQYIIKNNHKHLLLFFAGWGMDETPFLECQPIESDWMICYDYRSLEFNDSFIENYSNITLIAWSMGVWVASQIVKQHPALLSTKRIAVNGTLYPISDIKGIAPSIFNGTLRGLNEQTLQRFQRRMCTSAGAYKEFQMTAPQRSVCELKEELAAIQDQVLARSSVLVSWQKAIIGTKDCIFLPQNQMVGWESLADSVEEVDAAHFQIELFKKLFQHTLVDTL